MSRTTILRDYQWRAASYIVSSIIDGEKQMAIVAPTGAGKSTIITSISLRLKSKSGIRGGIIAAPQQAIEGGFYEDAEYYAPDLHLAVKSSVSNRLIGKSKRENLYKLLRESSDKVDDMINILSGVSPTNEPKWALTTHQQMTHWGDSFWPSNLSGLVLILDEAHHAGETTKLFELCSEWIKRGGQVIYVTATPYRADGNLIYPDNIPVFIWTISEHANSGFAPNNFVTKTVPIDAKASNISEYSGDVVPGNSTLAEDGIRKMVQTWIIDGLPKSVFILPASNSIELSNKLEELLVAQGARVANVVGTDESRKNIFISTLDAEKKTVKFSESKVDVFIACKRFDEGTDWPLCSHVYNWGVTKSIGLTLQRWGRAFRSKQKFSDYPEQYKNTACITFFPLKTTEDFKLENKHFELSWLLATFMSDWQTARKFENKLNLNFKNAITKVAQSLLAEVESEEECDEILELEEEMIQAIKDSDTTRIMAKAELAKIERILLSDGRSPTIEAIESYIKTMNIGDDTLKSAMEKIMVEEIIKQDPSSLDFLNNKIDVTISKFPDKIIKANLLDIFRSVLLDYKDKTLSISDEIVSFQTTFTGQDSLEISSILKELVEKPDLNIDLVKNIIKQYYDKNGKIPHQRVDGYIEFLPYKETWRSLHLALLTCGRGITEKSSIRKLCEELELVIGKVDLSIEDIKFAVSEYIKDNKILPTKSSGDASMYFDGQENWSAIDSALSGGWRGLNTSITLRSLCQDMGLIQDSRISRKNVIDAITIYKDENGKCPTSSSGDATKYFGFNTNWSIVYQAFARGSVEGVEDGLGFIEFMVKNNLKDNKGEFNLEIVKNAILEFYDETKSCPVERSGDATKYFGFKITWKIVEKRLRQKLCGLREQTSLQSLCIELGLKVVKPQLSNDIIIMAIKKYYDENSFYPTQRSGDATKYFGFQETWASVSSALFSGTRGLKANQSIFSLRQNMGS